MSYRVTRLHEIAAGHRVVGHESKCAHLHGHNYGFEFTCRGALDEVGRVIDFAVIKQKLCNWLENEWDHRLLLWVEDPWLRMLKSLDDKVCSLPFNPTAENMARYLVEVVGPEVLRGTGVELVSVRVQETGKCSAAFSHKEPSCCA